MASFDPSQQPLQEQPQHQQQQQQPRLLPPLQQLSPLQLVVEPLRQEQQQHQQQQRDERQSQYQPMDQRPQIPQHDPLDQEKQHERPASLLTTSSSGSSSSSTKATDPQEFQYHSQYDAESQRPSRPPVPHWKLVAEPAGVDDAVLRHAYKGHGTPESPFIVDFLPGSSDPRNPQAWPAWKKWAITLTVAVATLAVAFASTAYSPGVLLIVREFNVTVTVSILGVSLFVLGFAVGPLLWAPLSEFFGRQPVFFATYLATTVFNAAACGAGNIAGLLVLRFLAGAFGSSLLTNGAGVIADMFNAKERGLAAGVFAMMPFLGPSLGPLAGGFLVEKEGWRWVQALMAFFTGAVWIVGMLAIPETCAPVLLRKRAAKLSQLTGRVYVSKMDYGQPQQTVWEGLRVALSRPWILLFREPIVTLMSLYVAIIYGTLYMMIPAFPIVFTLARHWSVGKGGLAFLGILFGVIVAIGWLAIDMKRRYIPLAEKHDGQAPPEARLPPAIAGSFLIPIGLFWFAWSNGPEVHWIVPILGSFVFAVGLILVFLSLLNYLVDSYVIYAASVLAANTVLRSLFGFAFPLFTNYMYSDLGSHWASSLPGFLALACIPCPWLFYIYGEKVRKRCKFSAEAAEVLKRMQRQDDDDDDVHNDVAAIEGQQAQQFALQHTISHRLSLERRKSAVSAARAAEAGARSPAVNTWTPMSMMPAMPESTHNAHHQFGEQTAQSVYFSPVHQQDVGSGSSVGAAVPTTTTTAAGQPALQQSWPLAMPVSDHATAQNWPAVATPIVDHSGQQGGSNNWPTGAIPVMYNGAQYWATPLPAGYNYQSLQTWTQDAEHQQPQQQ